MQPATDVAAVEVVASSAAVRAARAKSPPSRALRGEDWHELGLAVIDVFLPLGCGVVAAPKKVSTYAVLEPW
jgi:hypothetical protein